MPAFRMCGSIPVKHRVFSWALIVHAATASTYVDARWSYSCLLVSDKVSNSIRDLCRKLHSCGNAGRSEVSYKLRLFLDLSYGYPKHARSPYAISSVVKGTWATRCLVRSAAGTLWCGWAVTSGILCACRCPLLCPAWSLS